ncbi:hypothetical protein JQ582_11290 [Bradyrhizobium japonicum]|uniref:Transposase n=1 Tax=Bradyrhizobium japonicum TaxID=375 RepID=A0ABV2RI67_BRAJP|nr:hypothetical protein [Bradyrhizobium japonicum]MBR0744514.1 hypothetical protein [Bradyrhizobium japonicum]UQD99620.1 hypothetical protein JEY30_04860 [Bradyrhizobium japonicum]WLB19627.1 hypothetical protein QIH95_01180 [Bradyrhizobium japonicum]
MQYTAQHFAAEAAALKHQPISQSQALRKYINSFRVTEISLRPIAMLHFFAAKLHKRKRAPEGAL